MLTQEEFAQALRREIAKAGTQSALAEKSGMRQSQISDYLRGRFQLREITVGTLYRLFPQLEIRLQSETDEPEPASRNMEALLAELYRSLPPEQQVRCFALVMANFGKKLP